METAIGVFATRDRAEEAVNELLRNNVPENSIVFLTRSESEAKTVGKQLGAYAGGVVGGAAGMSVGVAAAVLLAVPGIGPVFALGFGAAALLGLRRRRHWIKSRRKHRRGHGSSISHCRNWFFR